MAGYLPSGFTKTPWGFTLDSKGLVATTSVKARNERAELGEFAIELLVSLGITEEKLLELRENPDETEDFVSSCRSYLDSLPTTKVEGSVSTV
jgi:hypothetical protein